MKKLNIILIVLFVLSVASCTYKFPEPATPSLTTAEGTLGRADFTKYVAIGNSITAGYMDGALYRNPSTDAPAGQDVCYPLLLANMFKSLGGGEFVVPFVSSTATNGVGISSSYLTGSVSFSGRLRFVNTGCIYSSFAPVPSTADMSVLAPFVNPMPNAGFNMGVPGMRMTQIGTNGFGSSLGNPFYARIASSPTTSVISQVKAMSPTFFTLWLGNNDALAYAASGGVGTSNQISSKTDFEAELSKAIDSLLSSNSVIKGVVADIPDLLLTPYFTQLNDPNSLASGHLVKPFPLTQVEADSLNSAYKAQNAPPAVNSFGNSDTYFRAGNNYHLITTKTGLRQWRQGDMFLLPMGRYLDSVGRDVVTSCRNVVLDTPFNAPRSRAGWGVISTTRTVDLGYYSVPMIAPIPDSLVLDASEAANVRTAINDFNAAIANVVANKGANKIGLVRISSTFNMVMQQKGVRNTNGQVIMYTDMGPSGMFTSDGVHPTPKGQAFIANQFISFINSAFGVAIPTYDLTKYRGNDFPVIPSDKLPVVAK